MIGLHNLKQWVFVLTVVCMLAQYACADTWVTTYGGRDNFPDGNTVIGYESDLTQWKANCCASVYPYLGLHASSQVLYSYFGFRLQFSVYQLQFSFLAAGGWYHRRESSAPYLGLPFEFREDVRIGFRIHENIIFGAGIYHLSNAGIGEINPGLEGWYTFLAWRLN